MIKLAVERNNINSMVEYGIRLHGHSGPYLNLGIKMGLLALEILEVKGYFDLSTEVELEYHTPMSCLIDGLQVSTGCTLGKGNIKVIKVKDNPGIISALFKADRKTLLVNLKPEIMRLIDFQKESCETLGQLILNMSDKQLFDYEVKYESAKNN
jgi:formylmethanofuran dehydrogenase subunit E